MVATKPRAMKTMLNSAQERKKLERCETAKLFEAAVDVLPCEGAEALDTELLAAKAAHNRTINYCPVQLTGIKMPVLQIEAASRQVSHKTTGDRKSTRLNPVTQ